MPYSLNMIRIFRAPPERVWRALTEPLAIVKWNPPDGFVAEMHECDLRPGGRYSMSFVSLDSWQRQRFGGEYRDVVPNKRLAATVRFDGDALPGEILTIYSLRPVSNGTELVIEQSGLPDLVPPEDCRMGWQLSLDLLGRLVEASQRTAEPGNS